MIYQYKPLAGTDIRLVSLLPGTAEQPLCAKIVHQPLVQSDHATIDSSISIREMDGTLPSGWSSYRTPEGRWVFSDGREIGFCQYNHPSLEIISFGRRERIQEALHNSNEPGVVRTMNTFEALSYVWGDPNACHTFYILGDAMESSPAELSITRNLSEALQHLRRTDTPRLLWVDAICINQQDIQERTAQVRRMADIYSYAHRVVVWLGEASDDSSLALRTLQYLGEQLEITQDGTQFLAPDAQEYDWAHFDHKLPYETAEWDALAALMSRAWFSRIWVLQEVTLANANTIVQCGNESIAYYHFRRGVIGLRTRTGVPDELQDHIESRVYLSYGLKDASVCDLISIAREHMCSVPHDRVYGMLGFLGPRLQEYFQPSYEKAFMDVYREVFLAYSLSTGRLELLTHCFPVDDLDASWIPDWRSYGDSIPAIPAAITQSSGFSRAHFRQIDRTTLEVVGIIHGTVASVFDTLSSESGDRVGSWLRKLMKTSIKVEKYANGKSMHDEFAKLLCRNQLRERFPEVHHFDDLDEWLETLGELLERLDADSENDLDLEGFVRTQWDHWELRRFFATSSNYLGAGPLDIKLDDQIVVVLGLYCPLILRPTDAGTFQIVGGCYIQGLMDSEALLGELPDGWTIHQHNVQHRFRPRYYNEYTEESRPDDPRLDELTVGWRRIDRELTTDDPEHVDFFENGVTGEVINYDPRLSIESLISRHVPLCCIRLV